MPKIDNLTLRQQKETETMIVDIQTRGNQIAVSFDYSDFTCSTDLELIVSSLATGILNLEWWRTVGDSAFDFVHTMKPNNRYTVLVSANQDGSCDIWCGIMPEPCTQTQ